MAAGPGTKKGGKSKAVKYVALSLFLTSTSSAFTSVALETRSRADLVFFRVSQRGG